MMKKSHNTNTKLLGKKNVNFLKCLSQGDIGGEREVELSLDGPRLLTLGSGPLFPCRSWTPRWHLLLSPGGSYSLSLIRLPQQQRQGDFAWL